MDLDKNKIDGREIAQDILNNLKPKVLKLKNSGITPSLAIILIGNDNASESYIKQKELKAKEIGAEIILFRYDSISEDELTKKIKELNDNPNIHGIIIQRPLPNNIDKQIISRIISIEKDVDGFNDESAYDAPVAKAIFEILSRLNIDDLSSMKIVIVGKGETAGMPIIKLLDKKELSFKIIDSKTKNPEKIIKNSNIIISAVGKENIIKGEWLNNNQILIGVGLTLENGKLKTDYDEEQVKNRVKNYTPRIGGVGPINVAFLMQNLIQAASYVIS